MPRLIWHFLKVFDDFIFVGSDNTVPALDCKTKTKLQSERFEEFCEK